MYIIKTANHSVELIAKARYYREFKNSLGCNNLKQAFFSAFEDLDVDFLVEMIIAFAKDRTLNEKDALDILDECLEEGKELYDLYAEASEFLNGMGFFGKLELSEGESVISYFEDRTNKLNMDEKIATALDQAMDEVVNQMVAERLSNQMKA